MQPYNFFKTLPEILTRFVFLKYSHRMCLKRTKEMNNGIFKELLNMNYL